MYARNYGDETKMQSFKRGEYSIPANYAGNAFTADEVPDVRFEEDTSPDITEDNEKQCEEFQGIPEAKNEISTVKPSNCGEDAKCPMQSCRESCPCQPEHNDHTAEKPRQGIFRDLLARFERGFELDDLLLIGLIILLLHSGKDESEGSRDEIIILLAFLLISGF